MTGKPTALSAASPPLIARGACLLVASDRSILSVRSQSGPPLGARTRSYHIACSPSPSATSHGWKRSFMKFGAVAPLITCGVLQLAFLSRAEVGEMEAGF